MAVTLFVPLRTRSLWVNIIIACLPINLLLRFKPHSGLIYYEYVDGQNCCLNGVVYLNERKGEINDVLCERNRPSVQTPSWLSVLLEHETCVPTKWKANINWDVSAKMFFPLPLLFSVRYRFMDVHAVKRFGVRKIIYLYFWKERNYYF